MVINAPRLGPSLASDCARPNLNTRSTFAPRRLFATLRLDSCVSLRIAFMCTICSRPRDPTHSRARIQPVQRPPAAGVLNRLHFPGFLASLIHERTQLELTLTLTVPRRCPHSHLLPFSPLLFPFHFLSLSLSLYSTRIRLSISGHPYALTTLRKLKLPVRMGNIHCRSAEGTRS